LSGALLDKRFSSTSGAAVRMKERDKSGHEIKAFLLSDAHKRHSQSSRRKRSKVKKS
jgi:hypothetical protein